MATFIPSPRHQYGRATRIPRALARADRRAIALGYLLGTGCAAAVIAEVFTRTT